MSFSAGTVIDDQYTLIELIGEGGMGSVFKAREHGLNRIVAIKVLHPTLVGDEKCSARFIREGKVLAALSHPYIVKLYRFALWDSRHPYIVMEYIQGKSLTQLQADGVAITPEMAIDIAVKICQAMTVLHSAGIIHRDLTPNNVLLLKDQSGRALHPKLIDFGLSAFFSQSDSATSARLTETGMLIGTLLYMSPEVCLGQKADARSDVYSLGCLLHQLISGRPPFEASNPIAIMRMHTGDDPPPLTLEAGNSESLVAGLEHAILRAMAKKPEDRYQTMSAFEKDLQLVIEGRGDLIQAVSRSKVKARRARIPIAMLSVPGALVIVLLAVLGFRARTSPEQPISTAKQQDVRLKRLKNLDNYSGTEKIEYLNNWLAKHGDALNFDTVSAKLALADVLSKQEGSSAAAYKLYQETARGASVLENQALSEGKPVASPPGAEFELIANLIRARIACHQEEILITELSSLLQKLEQKHDVRYQMRENKIRAQLGKLYMEKDQYALAIETLKPCVEGSDEVSTRATELLELLLALCQCYNATGQKAQLTRTLNESLILSERMFRFHGVECKQQLMLLAHKNGNFDQCLGFAALLDDDGEREKATGYGGAVAFAKADCLARKGEKAKAMQVLSTQIKDAKVAVTPAALKLYCELIRQMGDPKSDYTSMFSAVMRKPEMGAVAAEVAGQMIRTAFWLITSNEQDAARQILQLAEREIAKPMSLDPKVTDLANMAGLYVVLGDYCKSEQLLGQVENAFGELEPTDYNAYIAYYGSKTALLDATGKSQTALELCSMKIGEIGDTYVRGASGLKSKLYILQSRAYAAEGKFHEAEQILNKGLMFCRKHKLGQHEFGTLLELAVLYSLQGDKSKSKHALNSAQLVDKNLDAEGRRKTFVSLFTAHSKRSQARDILAWLNKSVTESLN